jgi:hypothetical protein
VNEVISAMRDSFPYTVVDNGHGFSDVNLRSSIADHIPVVVFLNLPAIRAAQRPGVFRQLNWPAGPGEGPAGGQSVLPQKDIGIEQPRRSAALPGVLADPERLCGDERRDQRRHAGGGSDPTPM